jgi:acyl-coenzyme A thioesterase PaaI-like protein
MTDATTHRSAEEEPPYDPARGDLTIRRTPFSLDMGFKALNDRPCGMRAPFRADLMGDPAHGGLADGVVIALLDQTCGMAVSLTASADAEQRGLRFRGMATLDFHLDHIRAARPGAAVTAEAECLSLVDDIAVVRAFAYDTDRADLIAAVECAFMVANTPLTPTAAS